MLALAVAWFFHIDRVSGKICCNNTAVLNQARKVCQRVRVGIKHLDLHRAVRNLKCSTKIAFRYAHVRAHQDRIKPWSQLSLEEQLNVTCDELANGAIARYLSERTKPSRTDQFLPLESAAIVLDSVKLTTNVGAEVQFRLGKEEALRFYTRPKEVINGRNTGCLGWSTHRFNQVVWDSLDSALRTKLDMFQVWLSKQCIGICATWKNMARIQDLLDNKCPNCLQPQETSQHLNRCPDQGHTLLFKDSICTLVSWMHKQDRMDPKLAFWIEKYLLFWGTRSLVGEGGPATPLVSTAVSNQDLIGWVEFLNGKVSVEFWMIQDIHCALSSCRMTGEDWMKVFISHLIQVLHSQWILCNFTLHDKQRGYLSLLKSATVLKEVDRLLDTAPEDIPAGSQYLLELNYSTLYNASLKRQSYWVLAMSPACRAGKQEATASKRMGRAQRKLKAKQLSRKPRYNFSREEARLQHELVIIRPL
jgi:hypothetical protein